MTDLTLVSLFDGIGGFPLAFSRAGVRTVAAVEIDVDAAAVAHQHFPHAAQFPDVTEVSADDLRSAGFVPNRGILTAGWPCQDFSVAGRRAGLGGARSGLWWEVVRLLADLRPRWFIGENVPGLLSSVCQCPGDGSCIANGRAEECGEWRAVKPGVDVSSGRFRTVKRTQQVWAANVIHDVKGGCCAGGCMETHGGAMGSVLGSLAELGYGFAYRVLDAQHFGVPQQRKRVVIVGHLGTAVGAAAQVLLEPESGGGDSAPSRSTWPDVAPTLEAGANATGGTRPPGTTVDTATSLVVAPTLVDRYAKGTGSDATDALIIDTHNESGVDAAGRQPTRLQDRRRISSGRSPRRSREVVAALTSNGVGTCGPDDNQAQAGHLIAQAVNENQRGELTLSDSAAPLSSGGGKPGQGYAAVCVTGERTHTLTSEGADASEDGTGRGTPIVTAPKTAATLTAGVSRPGVSAPGRHQEDDHNLVAATGFHLTQDPISSPERVPAIGAKSTGNGVHQETVVRRLTPLECERLQGYPDGWTDGQSDSARYRQLGNSIAVPVFEWVARRLIAVDAEARADG